MRERMGAALQQVGALERQLEVVQNRHMHVLDVAAAERQGLEAQLTEARGQLDDLAAQLALSQTHEARWVLVWHARHVAFCDVVLLKTLAAVKSTAVRTEVFQAQCRLPGKDSD